VRTDVIYGKLRELIVSGTLGPGTRLVEATVARRLGASRTPVRSAFHRLQQEGYAVPADLNDQRMRLIVAPATAEDGSELYHILGELEGLAGFYAANLPQGQRTQLVKEIQEINRQLAAQSEADGSDLYHAFQLDALFHRRCVELSAPPRLLALNEAIKPQADRYARLYSAALIGRYDPTVAVEEHDVIIRAIEAGNAAAAQEAVRDNWRHGAERIAAAIKKWGESGGW